MKREHTMHPLHTMILVCLLLQTVILYVGCSNDVNINSNSKQIIHLEQNEVKEKNKFFHLPGDELRKFNKTSIKKILNNKNIIFVTNLTSEDQLIEAAAKVDGDFDCVELAELQTPKGLVIYQNEKGDTKIVVVIGQCLLSDVKEELNEGRKDEKGQEDFIRKTDVISEISEAWKHKGVSLEDLYSTARDLQENESQGNQSCIFVYFGYDGARIKELGISTITINAEKLKFQGGYHYDKVNSSIKVYVAKDGELRSFNLKHGVRSDDSAVILGSEILSNIHNAQILFRGGLTYSDLWTVTEIEKNCVDLKTESIIKHRKNPKIPLFRCGINYLTIRYGALDYKSPTDQVVRLKNE